MKKIISIYQFCLLIILATFFSGCVQDDKYNDPNVTDYQCGELTSTMTLAQVKAKYVSGTTYVFPENSTDILEGYVSSSDETGNIYKYIYIQDSPDNPTQGFTLSVNSLNNYGKFPQGSKIYIKLAGLAVGTYGNLVQLGAIVNGAFDRIPEKKVATSFLRSCQDPVKIVPKVMKLSEMVSASDKYLGCLIQVNDAEFTSAALCSVYAPPTVTVDRPIADPSTNTTRIVRNSGYASFANNILPAGKGKFIGIYSKFNTTYQMYVVRDTDLEMNAFPRKDGLTQDPCGFDPSSLTKKTISEVKQLYTTGNWNQITGDYYIKAQVTANDATGNLYKYVYVEDETGGIRVNINKTNLYQSSRYRVGKDIYIKLKNMYISKVNGELQLGGLFTNSSNVIQFGGIEEVDMYKYFFDAKEPIRKVNPTERTISQLTTDDVGRWIKIKDVQFIDADLGKPYAPGSTTNRTLEDCAGKNIIVRTSNFATFANKEVDGGKGDVYAILSIFNGTYQLWIPYQVNADFDNPRCDGTIPQKYETIYSEPFTNLSNWTAFNINGSQVWGTTTFGNPAPSAIMDGNRQPNEDWLVSKKFDIENTWKEIYFSFETDGRFTGNPLEVYISENFAGNVSTATWVKANGVILDTDLGGFAGFVGSGRISLTDYKGKSVTIAIKYTSVSGASTTWEMDNFQIKGVK